MLAQPYHHGPPVVWAGSSSSTTPRAPTDCWSTVWSSGATTVTTRPRATPTRSPTSPPLEPANQGPGGPARRPVGLPVHWARSPGQWLPLLAVDARSPALPSCLAAQPGWSRPAALTPTDAPLPGRRPRPPWRADSPGAHAAGPARGPLGCGTSSPSGRYRHIGQRVAARPAPGSQPYVGAVLADAPQVLLAPRRECRDHHRPGQVRQQVPRRLPARCGPRPAGRAAEQPRHLGAYRRRARPHQRLHRRSAGHVHDGAVVQGRRARAAARCRLRVQHHDGRAPDGGPRRAAHALRAGHLRRLELQPRGASSRRRAASPTTPGTTRGGLDPCERRSRDTVIYVDGVARASGLTSKVDELRQASCAWAAGPGPGRSTASVDNVPSTTPHSRRTRRRGPLGRPVEPR